MADSAPTEPPNPSANVATLPTLRSVFVTARGFVCRMPGGVDAVDVGQRRVGITSAEDIEDSFSVRRGGEPGRDPRFDCRPVRPEEYFPRCCCEGGAYQEGEFSRRRHVDRFCRGQLGITATIGDQIDERRLRCAIF